jgi:hypothetical protein
VNTELVEAARMLVPQIRAAADEIERELKSYEAYQAQVNNKADVEMQTLGDARQRPARPGPPSR